MTAHAQALPGIYGRFLELLIDRLTEAAALAWAPTRSEVRDAAAWLDANRPDDLAQLDAEGLRECPGFVSLVAWASGPEQEHDAALDGEAA